jgi:hypothetical protein
MPAPITVFRGRGVAAPVLFGHVVTAAVRSH